MAQRGRKPRGDRTITSAAFPSDHLELYRAEAKRLRISLGDYLTIKLAEAHNLPEPEYIGAEQERVRKRDEAAARQAERDAAHQPMELPVSA